MIGHPETITITASESDISITIRDAGGDVFFDARSGLPGRRALPQELFTPDAVSADQEYVITFEFDTPSREAGASPVLRKLDAHVRNVTVRIHDDGHVVEGELTAWVGYTNVSIGASDIR